MDPAKNVVRQHAPIDRFARCQFSLEMFPPAEEEVDPHLAGILVEDIVVGVAAELAVVAADVEVGPDSLALDIVVEEEYSRMMDPGFLHEATNRDAC